MPRAWIQLLVTLLAAAGLRAGVFEDANQLYEKGKFPEAIALYQNLLKSGHRSPGVLFNLGNASFKNGELGRAIYFYRRAQEIAPRDPDARANLGFARDRVPGAISVRPGPLGWILGRVTIDELAGAATVLLWAWMGLLCWVRWRPSSRGALRGYTALCAVLFIAVELLTIGAYREGRRELAIVTGRQAVVRLGPLAESQQAFAAPDGAELRVLARREDWLQVEDRAGHTGWIDRRNVLLFPSV